MPSVCVNTKSCSSYVHVLSTLNVNAGCGYYPHMKPLYLLWCWQKRLGKGRSTAGGLDTRKHKGTDWLWRVGETKNCVLALLASHFIFSSVTLYVTDGEQREVTPGCASFCVHINIQLGPSVVDPGIYRFFFFFFPLLTVGSGWWNNSWKNVYNMESTTTLTAFSLCIRQSDKMILCFL